MVLMELPVAVLMDADEVEDGLCDVCCVSSESLLPQKVGGVSDGLIHNSSLDIE
jgi:hypothetical protein